MRRQVSAPGPLNAPQPVRVQASVRGEPIVVAGEPVKLVSNEWLSEDGWWLKDELHRRYYEVSTISKEGVVVFHDLTRNKWFRQRA